MCVCLSVRVFICLFGWLVGWLVGLAWLGLVWCVCLFVCLFVCYVLLYFCGLSFSYRLFSMFVRLLFSIDSTVNLFICGSLFISVFVLLLCFMYD